MAMRAFFLLFGVAHIALVVVLLARPERQGLDYFTSLILIGMLFFYARMWGLGVFSDGEELTIRNTARTHRASRSNIEGFRVGAAPGAVVGKAVHLLLRDGSVVTLDVLTGIFGGDRGRRQLQTRLDQMNTWLAGR